MLEIIIEVLFLFFEVKNLSELTYLLEKIINKSVGTYPGVNLFALQYSIPQMTKKNEKILFSTNGIRYSSSKCHQINSFLLPLSFYSVSQFQQKC